MRVGKIEKEGVTGSGWRWLAVERKRRGRGGLTHVPVAPRTGARGASVARLRERSGGATAACGAKRRVSAPPPITIMSKSFDTQGQLPHRR